MLVLNVITLSYKPHKKFFGAVYLGVQLRKISISAVDGYWGTIVYGCAGKISNNEYVYIEPVFPCTLVGEEYGKALSLRKVLPSTKAEPKSTWSATEIGTCSYDGVSLTNCKYAYCEGLQIGFKKSDVESYDVYKGTLIFNFGIASN